MKKEPPYNPLDKKHLGESVARQLLARPIEPLPPPEQFAGAGVYAIYYAGSLSFYAPVAELNAGGRWRQPIYVGKAVPAGARKGGFGLGEDPGTVLFRRLGEHADSVTQASNLARDDFACRYLVADDIWIPLAESVLIDRFRPVWNLRVDGFGNHDPGAGRYNQARSPWDVLHPGRTWARKLQPGREDAVRVGAGVVAFLEEKRRQAGQT